MNKWHSIKNDKELLLVFWFKKPCDSSWGLFFSSILFDYRYSHSVIFFHTNGLQNSGMYIGMGSKRFIKSLCSLHHGIILIRIEHFTIADYIVGNNKCSGSGKF